MHGGGWTNGYKEWMAFMAPAFTAAGVTFATVGYRLAPKNLFPAGVDDAIAALAWLHDNAAAFDCDPARIFLGGHWPAGTTPPCLRCAATGGLPPACPAA